MLDIPDTRDPALHRFRNAFDSGHLPPGRPTQIMNAYKICAQRLLATLPDSPWLTDAINSLWESKNQAVMLAIQVQETCGPTEDEQTTDQDAAVTAKLEELIDRARENKRVALNDNLGDSVVRHWSGVSVFLRRELPADHPKAFRPAYPDPGDLVASDER